MQFSLCFLYIDKTHPIIFYMIKIQSIMLCMTYLNTFHLARKSFFFIYYIMTHAYSVYMLYLSLLMHSLSHCNSSGLTCLDTVM